MLDPRISAPDVSPQCLIQGKDHSPDLLAALFLMQPTRPQTIQPTEMHYKLY